MAVLHFSVAFALMLASLTSDAEKLVASNNCVSNQILGEERRQFYMQSLLRFLPKSEPWEEWLRSTGEQPPDFDAMPSIPDLPDPLTMYSDGSLIKTKKAWDARRQEIRSLFTQYVLGTAPPSPNNLRAEVVSSKVENGCTVQDVVLTFGPNSGARLGLELIIPPGNLPKPVFLTQHNHRGWAVIAVRRGYIACIYNAADSKDNTEQFTQVYPNYSWSALRRRAWAASRCVDYLRTLPEVDASKIVITGHSRNGKQSLIAAAYDDRISAVISSSSGAGGSMPYRFFNEAHFGEGIELLTRVFPHWFHPRLRFFVGREDKLPVDNNLLISLVAPRPCLLSTAVNDPVESTWGMQLIYLSCKKVYSFLGSEDKLALRWRPGSHETRAEEIEDYLDWCDYVFGRGGHGFPERLLHPAGFQNWLKLSGEKPGNARFETRTAVELAEGDVKQWDNRRLELVSKIKWLLGEEPPRARHKLDRYGAEASHTASMLGRAYVPEDVEKLSVTFGEYCTGDVYAPKGAAASGKKLPAVLWLHPWSFSNGYTAGYRRGEQPYINFARHGYAVFCFDMIGFGTRIEEGEGFYRRAPKWSLLGKMVRDAEDAVTALAELPFVDSNRIYCVGYSLGGMVGIFLSALDERVAG
ncbi:MAG: acetylxylan esterase, partial [Armatimonadota bacterium]